MNPYDPSVQATKEMGREKETHFMDSFNYQALCDGFAELFPENIHVLMVVYLQTFIGLFNQYKKL